MPGHGLLVRPPVKTAKPLNLLKSSEKAIRKPFANDVMFNAWLPLGQFAVEGLRYYLPSTFPTKLDPEKTKAKQ
jgi:hypothetical protein